MKQDIEFIRATANIIKSGCWWKMGTTATAKELDEIADRLEKRLIPMRGKVNGADRKLRR